MKRKYLKFCQVIWLRIFECWYWYCWMLIIPKNKSFSSKICILLELGIALQKSMKMIYIFIVFCFFSKFALENRYSFWKSADQESWLTIRNTYLLKQEKNLIQCRYRILCIPASKLTLNIPFNNWNIILEYLICNQDNPWIYKWNFDK